MCTVYDEIAFDIESKHSCLFSLNINIITGFFDILLILQSCGKFSSFDKLTDDIKDFFS